MNVSVGEKGLSYKVNRAGTVVLNCAVNGKVHRMVLHHVLYAPKAPGNFVALSHLDRMNLTTQTSRGVMTISSPNGNVVAKAPMSKLNNLYFLDCVIAENRTWRHDFAAHLHAPQRLNKLSTAQLIHRRMGHLGYGTLNKTLKEMKLPTVRPGEHAQCTACELTGTNRPQVRARKHRRKKRREREQSKSMHDDATNGNMDDLKKARTCENGQTCCERIHSDVKTMPRSHRGYKFFAVFVHEPTRRLIVKKFKSKSELADAAIAALEFTQKQGSVVIVEFRSDYESIYKCSKLTDFLDANGIKFSPATPYRHEQNGIAERIIQTLMRKMRAMLKQCGLSNHFWCYALDCATTVYNRTRHNATKKIPDKEFFKREVDIDDLVVFGCIGVAHIDEEKRSSKHDITRGELVRMLGYDENGRNGTYLVCNRQGKIFRARVAKWHEDVYSFRELLKQLPMPKPLARASTAMDADEKLLEDEAALQEEMKMSDELNKKEERGHTRASRKAKSRLRFIPGVNYAPRMYHMNHLHENEMKDERIMNANDQEAENFAAYIECLMRECKEQNCDTKFESWLNTMEMSAQEILKIPKSFREAVTGPEKEFWIPSVKSEISSLNENKTWRVIERRRNKNTVKMKWVFRKKVNADGSIRYKTRLVVKGYTQVEGEDFFRTHAPTLSLGSLRIVLAIASRHKLMLHNIDIKTAFLYGAIDADINSEIPDGLFEFEPEKLQGFSDPVLQLQRAIYGLRQAGYVWIKTYMSTLKTMGFKQCNTDPCVFVKTISGRKMIVAIYVDDTIIAHEAKCDLEWFLAEIGKHFKFKNEGELKWALGMEVGRTSQGNWWIGQQRYIQKMAQIFAPIRTKVQTPLQAHLRLDFRDDSPAVDQKSYKSLLGSLLYVAVATRPDIAFACSRLAQFGKNPRKVHHDQALRVLQFLINTSDRVICCDANEGFVGFADASLETCKRTGRSYTGYVLTLAGAPVLWRAFMQNVCATSTGEAEYMALSALCKEVVFATQLSTELGFEVNSPVVTFDDSEPAIAIAMGTGLTKRSRSFRLSFHNVRDCVSDGTITLRKVSGKTNPADIFTKALSVEAHNRYCKLFYKRRKD